MLTTFSSQKNCVRYKYKTPLLSYHSEHTRLVNRETLFRIKTSVFCNHSEGKNFRVFPTAKKNFFPHSVKYIQGPDLEFYYSRIIIEKRTLDSKGRLIF